MSKCLKCKSLCCKYVTVDIPAPKYEEDYDEVRWYLLHKNVVIYKVYEEKNWRLEFQSFCEYQDNENHSCSKYSQRPDVCKEYTTEECGGMEEMSPEGCEIHLENEMDFLEYLKKKNPKMMRKVFKSILSKKQI